MSSMLIEKPLLYFFSYKYYTHLNVFGFTYIVKYLFNNDCNKILSLGHIESYLHYVSEILSTSRRSLWFVYAFCFSSSICL